MEIIVAVIVILVLFHVIVQSIFNRFECCFYLMPDNLLHILGCFLQSLEVFRFLKAIKIIA
ncbi:MAG: hypothetical protein SO402_01665, partial [Prevotella sp.]|nr:hypothetical protein [Prevotella sp.]